MSPEKRHREWDMESSPTRKRIQIELGPLTFRAVLNETPTAKAIYEALPLEGTTKVWEDRKNQIYFSIPVEMEEEEDAQEYVEPGDLGYWPPAQAFCIFIGIPALVDASNDDHPTRSVQERGFRRPYHPESPVNMIGRIEGDIPPDIQLVDEGDPIRITALT